MNNYIKTYNDEGIVQIQDFFESHLLEGLENQCCNAIKNNIDQWKVGISKGELSSVFFDLTEGYLSNPIERLFIEKLELLYKMMGFQNLILNDSRLRLTTPYPLPYVQWHRDHRLPGAKDVRITIYLNDVYPNSGEFCYVKKSHTSEELWNRKTSQEIVSIRGYSAYSAKKGTIILFDPYGVHSVHPNLSSENRLALMYYYNRKRLE